MKILNTIVIVVMATFFQYLMWDWIHPTAFLIFFPAVVLTAMYGNGYLGILLSAISAQYFFIEPFYNFQMVFPSDYIRLIIFIGSSLMIIRLSRGYVLLEFERLTNIRLIKERLQREQFIAGIAHDIRSPLTVILSSAQLLQKGITGKSIDRIIENTKRSERMIQNILESSKYTLDHFCIKNEEICDLKKICIDVTENFNNVRRISYDFPEDQVLGKWDKEGVHRIFENLISNAIKYGDEESPILIKINNDRKSVSFSITNFGKPLTKKVQHNLFKSFWRGSEAIKDGKNGWGLGLFVVKGLVEAFKGKIKVESSADKGTKFQVTLPNMLRS